MSCWLLIGVAGPLQGVRVLSNEKLYSQPNMRQHTPPVVKTRCYQKHGAAIRFSDLGLGRGTS